MRITKRRLISCAHRWPDCHRFIELYPRGVRPSILVLTEAAAAGIDVWGLANLLPDEGPGSKRAYALWCVEQVAHLTKDPRVESCLAIVRQKVEDPADDARHVAEAGPPRVALEALAGRVAAAARAAAAPVAQVVWAAAWAAGARAAAWGTMAQRRDVWDAERGAQLACLTQLLLEAA